ncbi:hypothetical protein [Mesorhizobium sp.]|uniref:DUF7024 domain-containing protein n=1 Tax=Mesorhizobium sp. TaxID=1871066 RepID=UPI0012153FDC|nr:hypothetical protein [Mesorhizobium sp.]TIS50598.1 MAG: hypothetical protein E5W96_10010 [Mesorhizobium sp.]
MKLDHRSRYSHFVYVAIVFALTSLIKPHSLFFLPGVVLYFAHLIRQRSEQAWVGRWLWISTIFVSVAIATKMALGFAFAGRAGITLFGATYGSIASGAAADMGRYVDLVKLTGVSLAGHFLALSILFGTPLAAVLFNLRKVLSRNEAENTSVSIALYALAIFSTLVPVVALFSASVANAGPYETPFRLHMRYYNFALPLLLIASASQMLSKERSNVNFESAMIAAPIAAAAIYAGTATLNPYIPSIIDNPEVRGLTYNRFVFYALSAISILSLLIWIYDRRLGSRIFLFIFAPLAVIFASYFSSLELRNRLYPDVFDEAGIFAHQYLEGDDASRLAIMGSNPAGLFRSLFYVDDPQASIIEIPAGSPADLSRVPADKEWLLLIGDHAPPPSSHFKLALNGFSLFRIAGTDKIDFTRQSWPGILSRAQGLSSAEAWGTWSDGPTVTLEFETPLPKKLILHLTAHAFGPNVGRNVTAHIGSESAEFVLSDSPREIAIPFRNPEASRSISISVPNPISPKELGLSEDSRKLGIAFNQLSVEDTTQ